MPYIVHVKNAIKFSLQEAYANIEEVRQLALKPDGPAPYGETAELDFVLLQEAFEDQNTVLGLIFMTIFIH